jgi:HAD superfamily hydrolase (TIGR01490 family)
MAIIFFDLDGTLISGLSAEKRFFIFLLRHHILRLRQLAAFLIFPLCWFVHVRKNVWKKNKAYLTGLKPEIIQAMAEKFVPRVLLPCLRPVVKRRLESHLAQGDTVILLTGTPDFIARPIAMQLGVSHIAATACAVKDGCFSFSPPSVHPFGPAKLQIAKQVCRNFNTNLSQCAAYADSASDISLLSSVAWPVAVHPDHKLQKISKRHGWEIIGNFPGALSVRR